MKTKEIKDYLKELRNITKSRHKRILTDAISRWEAKLKYKAV